MAIELQARLFPVSSHREEGRVSCCTGRAIALQAGLARPGQERRRPRGRKASACPWLSYGRMPSSADHNWLLFGPTTALPPHVAVLPVPPVWENPVRFVTVSCGRGLSVGNELAG